MKLFNWVTTTTLLSALVFAEDWQPKVNKVETKTSLAISPFDDSTTLLRIEDDHLVISTDNGLHWNPHSQVKDEIAWIEIDEFNPKTRAFVSAKGDNVWDYYLTNDIGKTWKKIHLGQVKDYEPLFCSLKTHPFKKEFLVVSCTICPTGGDGARDIQACKPFVVASNDEGKHFNQLAIPETYDDRQGKNVFKNTQCEFAKIDKNSNLKIQDSTIICNNLVQYTNNHNNEDSDQDHHNMMDPIIVISLVSDLLYSNDFGKTVKEFPQFKDMTVSSFEILRSYIVVITQDDKHNRFSPKRLWISKDGETFEQAFLPTQLRYENNGRLYEDDLQRIILPISRTDNSNNDDNNNHNDNNNNNDNKKQESHRHRHKDTTAEVYISDSTGKKFFLLEETSQHGHGSASYYPIDFLKGSSLLTVYSTYMNRKHRDGNNGGDEQSSHNMKIELKQVTKISTDNGHSWNNLKIVDPGNEKKYSCDISDTKNCFLSPLFFGEQVFEPSPGILLLIGSVSDGKLQPSNRDGTFISRDGGATWKMIFDFSTAYASGDYGNILVVVPFNPEQDNDPASEFYFSLDQGETWTEYQFEESMIPMEVVSVTQDGSGLNFMIAGSRLDQRDDSRSPFSSNIVYTIDFSDAFGGKKCKEADFEKWSVNNNECVSGSKYSYKRRKQDSNCLVKSLYEDLVWDEEICAECTMNDYECAFEFIKNEKGECIPDVNLLKLSGKCDNKKAKSIQLVPYSLIGNDKCKKSMKFDYVSLQCSEETKPVKSGSPIVATANNFNSKISFYQYFDSVEDETIIFVDNYGQAYISHDSGQNVKQIDTGEEAIQEVVFNPHFNSSAFLFGRKGSLFITHDRGNTFTSTELPDARQLGFPLDFSFTERDSFIYYGGKNCENPLAADCHAMAFITRDGGSTFTELISNSIHCEFAGSQYKKPVDKNLIICQVRDEKSSKRLLLSTTDDFDNDEKILYDNIIGYMSGDGYSVVAVSYGDHELRAFVTQDGEEFAEAKLPQELADMKQQTFTILGSQMGSIFMHMSTNNEIDHFYGDLLKSNSNGTSFVTLQKDVNRGNSGLVDFEVVQNLDGIILINIVSNPNDVKEKKQTKKLKTKITFNDGSDWSYLQPPQKDSRGKKYNCNSKNLDHCSLNLHGSSEYIDTRDTYSSGSAVGMMFALGSVGEYLLPEEECSTFFTNDGGRTWKEVAKGSHQWEFGDHGGVLVLVSKDKATNYVSYSLDGGVKWNNFVFDENDVLIKDIVTVPHDSALRFLLLTEISDVKGQYTRTYTIDFYNSFKRQCIFDINNQYRDDFEYTGIVGSKEECLFGHKSEFLMKIHNDCFIGNIPMSDFFRITENCKCTRKDFECDYNYYKANDGTCKLVEGLTPQAPIEMCMDDPDLIEYSEATGYRKIPLSTCEGGLTLDVTRDKYPCPGKEKEFKTKYGVSGRSFFQTFFIFFFLFIVFGYIVYDRGVRRNGGFARFGEIRLGDEEELVENNAFDKAINMVVKGGLVVASAVYTGIQLTKRFFNGSIRTMGDRFSPRRGPSYSSLINDQFLDEADDLLAGHDEDADNLASFIDHDTNFDIDDDESHNDTTTDKNQGGFRDVVRDASVSNEQQSANENQITTTNDQSSDQSSDPENNPSI